MTRIQELALVAGIFVLGMTAILEVADRAIARQDLIMQETH